jgi:hypothetical protein
VLASMMPCGLDLAAHVLSELLCTIFLNFLCTI